MEAVMVRMLKVRVRALFVFAALCLFLVSCGHLSQAPQAESASRLKIAYYAGAGSQGAGVVLLARLLAYSPQVDFTVIDGGDIRDGVLDGKDLLVVPGGDSGMQYRYVKEEGAEKIRKFVECGGSYFGVCAGFHCALNRNERFRLLPYNWYFGGAGMKANLAVELSDKAAERLQVPKGRYVVRYSRGPVSRRCEQPGEGWAEELAVFKNDMKWPKITFEGAPAMLYGEYGKGKVIATSFHPEYLVSTNPIALGCVYAVSGVKLTPVFPPKSKNVIRLAYMVNGLVGKYWLKQCLALDRQEDIDFSPISTFEEGILEHIDVLVCPNINEKGYEKTLAGPAQEQMRKFVERGGKILVSTQGLPYVPKHRNVVELKKGECPVASVRRIAK